jgi:hypothetical protein
MTGSEPLISFGIIVLNGEPFTRYCIKALYPHAYQIIVAEGACEGSRSIATPDGHSTDGTLELLRKIKKEEDPDNKITIVTAEDEGHSDGFWPGEKHEQSEAYTKRTTGNYLWQIDIDEFYKDEDIFKIIKLLKSEPEITAVSFRQKQFWGGFDYLVDSWYLRRGMNEFHRLFKWGSGYRYISHRPPTVINELGEDLRRINWLNADKTKIMGIHLYHYSFVFPKQVDEKVEYYRHSDWANLEHTLWWKNEVYNKLKYPYRAFINTHFPGWIEGVIVEHPGQIKRLIEDIDSGILKVKKRRTDDLERITSSLRYNLGVILLKVIDPLDFYLSLYFKTAKRKIKKILKT